MQEILFDDIGSVSIDQSELITDEVLCFVEHLNPTLGDKDDPYYEEYMSYLADINNAEIVTVDMEKLNGSSRFDDFDVGDSNGSQDEDTKYDIKDSYYVLLMNKMICYSQPVTPFDFDKCDEYGPPSQIFTPDFESFVELVK